MISRSENMIFFRSKKFLFPELGRGTSILFPEQAAEIQRIIIADQLGNFRHIVVGCFQKYSGIHHPERENKLRWCGTGVRFKITDKFYFLFDFRNFLNSK